MHIRPDVQILPIRGNQDTRLRKMKTENMDAIVLAMAGIHRRDFKDIHVCPLNVDVCLPAGGQGSLGVEIRRHDENVSNLTRPLNDPKASMCIRAERACLQRLEAECYTPVSAYGEITNSKIHLRALVADLSGKRVVKGELVGDPNDPESLGSELASRLLRKGAEEILKELKKQSRTL